MPGNVFENLPQSYSTTKDIQEYGNKMKDVTYRKIRGDLMELTKDVNLKEQAKNLKKFVNETLIKTHEIEFRKNKDLAEKLLKVLKKPEFAIFNLDKNITEKTHIGSVHDYMKVVYEGFKVLEKSCKQFHDICESEETEQFPTDFADLGDFMATFKYQGRSTNYEKIANPAGFSKDGVAGRYTLTSLIEDLNDPKNLVKETSENMNNDLEKNKTKLIGKIDKSKLSQDDKINLVEKVNNAKNQDELNKVEAEFNELNKDHSKDEGKDNQPEDKETLEKRKKNELLGILIMLSEGKLLDKNVAKNLMDKVNSSDKVSDELEKNIRDLDTNLRSPDQEARDKANAILKKFQDEKDATKIDVKNTPERIVELKRMFNNQEKGSGLRVRPWSHQDFYKNFNTTIAGEKEIIKTADLKSIDTRYVGVYYPAFPGTPALVIDDEKQDKPKLLDLRYLYSSDFASFNRTGKKYGLTKTFDNGKGFVFELVTDPAKGTKTEISALEAHQLLVRNIRKEELIEKYKNQ